MYLGKVATMTNIEDMYEGNDNYIKIELVCYTESDKDEIFALLMKNTEVLAWEYQCRQCDRALDTLTSICERCNDD